MTCEPPTTAFPPFAGVECADDTADFKVYFEVPGSGSGPADFYRLPFPNDIRVSTAGALDMSDFASPGPTPLGVDLVSLYVDALVADFRGFASVGPISFRFSSELDFASTSSDSVKLVDITPGAPEFGQERSRSWAYSQGRGLYRCQQFFTMSPRPHEPLLPNHTYAAYLTTALRSAGNAPVAADTGLIATLAASRPNGDAGLEHAWDQYQPFRDYLTAQTIDPLTIAGAAVFTVQDTVGRAKALADAVQTEALPVLKDLTLCDGATTSPCEEADGRGACSAVDPDFHEIHGRFTVPIYQAGTAPYLRPEDGGNINEVAGVPTKVRDEDVCFALSIPKNAVEPAGGWPFMVYAHGTGGSFTGAMRSGVADSAATSATPTAVFSFDGVVHGARRNGVLIDPDQLMFNVTNPQSARDNNLQGGVDVMQAIRVPSAGQVTLPGTGDTSFNNTQVFYFGHSQGSNVGVPAISVSGGVAGAIFSGAGAYLIDALLSKTSPVDAKTGLEFLLGEQIGVGHPVMAIWETYFNSVDTVNYGPLLVTRPLAGVPSKHVMMTWAQGDTFSPDRTLTHMARSAGLPVVNPAIEDLSTGLVSRPFSENRTGGDGLQRTAACFQYQPDGYDGHFVATRHPTAIADWVQFITSFVQNGTPTIN
jgi:hypothetical protein